MNRYYLTFGYNTDKGNHYQVVHAPDYGAARLRVFEEYGPAWAFLYDEEEFKGQAERYGITPLPTELTTIKQVTE